MTSEQPRGWPSSFHRDSNRFGIRMNTTKNIHIPLFAFLSEFPSINGRRSAFLSSSVKALELPPREPPGENSNRGVLVVAFGCEESEPTNEVSCIAMRGRVFWSSSSGFLSPSFSPSIADEQVDRRCLLMGDARHVSVRLLWRGLPGVSGYK